MTTRKVKSPAKQGTLTKKEINDAVKAVVSETKAVKPTIKSLQAELTQANAIVEMLEEGLANTKEIANENAAIANQAATEKAEYKRKYLEEINRSWWDITKERFVESLYRFKV